jgi:hypothetical protein
LLLATDSLAHKMADTPLAHEINTLLLPEGGLDYKVWMTREEYNEEHCTAQIDVVIQAQMHESATSSTGGLFSKPVYREKDVERKLRTGVSPRELGYCDEDCRCHTIIMCQIGGYCADSCHPCECRTRRRMVEEEFVFSQHDATEHDEPAGGYDIVSITDGGDVCPKWNSTKAFNEEEINDIMRCETSKALKKLAITLKKEGNNCLGAPDKLNVRVEIFAVPPVAPVNLKTAENYAILTKSGISTVPDSAITGDIAVSPIAATAMTGFSLTMDSSEKHWTSSQLTGKAFAADNAPPTSELLTEAVSDMEAAYTDAMSRPFNEKRRNLEGGVLGGGLGSSEATPLTTGVYTFTTDVVNIASDIYFSGTADDVFIIQLTGILKQAAGTTVHLSNGALAENIFWQVAGHAVVGAGAHMEGILMVKTQAVFETGSSLTGRVLAQTACILQKATITGPTRVPSL